MFRQRRSYEERCIVSPEMGKKSIGGSGGNNSILFKHNMDASLISQNMMTEDKENRPNHTKSTMKTPKRKRILMNAANNMKTSGTHVPQGQQSDTQTIATKYQGEGAHTNDNISCHNKRAMKVKEHKYTELKMMRAERIAPAHEFSIPSPQSIQRTREVKDLQVKMLGYDESMPTRIEMKKVRANKKLKAAIHQDKISWKVGSPFNEHTLNDYGFCISRCDIKNAMNDYRKATQSLMSEISNPTTYGSDIGSEDSTVQDLIIASNKSAQSRMDTPTSEVTDSLNTPSNSLSTFSSFNSPSQTSIYSRSYNSFDDEFRFNGSRSKMRSPRRFTSRGKNIVVVAATRTMQLLDTVTDRVCDCIAPTHHDSPMQRNISKSGNDTFRINGNEWNDAFYRNHRFENEYK